jgi:hypothetical protein
MYQYIDLASCHLTEATLTELANSSPDSRANLSWPAMSVAPYEHGIFFTVPAMEENYIHQQMRNLPQDLADVLRYAYSLGAQVVRLESDGEQAEELTYYEWAQ